MRLRLRCLVVAPLLLGACASDSERRTLAELRDVEPDVSEVQIDDSLEKAMSSYRSFLEETPANVRTPEAMRRLADLQIEKEYGILGGEGPLPESRGQDAAQTMQDAPLPAVAAGPSGPELLPQPERASAADPAERNQAADSATIADLSEDEDAFERRTTAGFEPVAYGADPFGDVSTTGPREAIETYQRILNDYPHYERNDQVLYQMARAYDELGEPDKAMEVMERLIAEYGRSEFADEVFFRRAEYYFVRKKYLDAEDAYGAVVAMGAGSEFYELALYKLGWSLYKQELYEDALHQYMALLDYKLSVGYDFSKVSDIEVLDDQEADAAQDATTVEEERRVADTFRVISLAFSNLGGPEVLNQYFASNGNRSYEDRI